MATRAREDPINLERSSMQRDVLPMPDQPHDGLVTYDAKDPATSFPADRAAAPAGGCPERADRAARRRGLRLVERLRWTLRDPRGGAPGRERAEVQPLSHDRALLAHAPGAADRAQPSLRRHGRDHRDRHVGARATTRFARTRRRRWRRRSSSTATPPPSSASATRCRSGRPARWGRSTPGPAAAAASSTSTASSAARPTSTRRRCTTARPRSSRTAPRRRATTSPRT